MSWIRNLFVIVGTAGAGTLPAFSEEPPAAELPISDGLRADVAAAPPTERQGPRPPAVLTEPLVTDRPDFTKSTEAVPFGRFQLEMGYTFTYDREDDVRTEGHTVPEFLLRAGLADDFELRLSWEGYTYEFAAFETTTRAGRRVDRDDWSQGGSDFNVGFKYKFLEQDGIVPHLGVIVGASLPSGSAGFSGGDVEPEAVLLWAYDVSDEFSVAGNVGFSLPNDAGDHYLQTSASLSLAYALTDRVGVYGEYFGIYPGAPAEDCAHTLNGGLTYLINDNLQLDWRAGFGLNEQADDFFTGVGISVRW